MSFSFDTIKDFDKHINKSIPFYKDVNKIIESIASQFYVNNTNIYDVGCSDGRLLSAIKTDKKIKKIGIDCSLNLLPPNNSDISFLHIDLCDNFIFNNASVVFSIFTMQFLPMNIRQQIITNIYNGLVLGGCFIFAEKVYSQDSFISDIFTFRYYDFKADNFSSDEILSKEKDLRNIMRPNTHADNVKLLEAAGFSKFEVFFKCLNFEYILAIR